jgi:hypothetical protein
MSEAHPASLGAVPLEGAFMFKKILTANRGDQPRSGAATQSHRPAREACEGVFAAEARHV